jgi:hypothetical protein
MRHYGAIRPFLAAFLANGADDAADSGGFDDFTGLFVSADLDEFLAQDDGWAITRITRTRQAINLYAQHLRQLSDRTA